MIEVGNHEAWSGPFSLAQGERAHVMMTPPEPVIGDNKPTGNQQVSPIGYCNIYIKGRHGGWATYAELGGQKRVHTLIGPGTFVAHRLTTDMPFGVELAETPVFGRMSAIGAEKPDHFRAHGYKGNNGNQMPPLTPIPEEVVLAMSIAAVSPSEAEVEAAAALKASIAMNTITDPAKSGEKV